MFPSSLRQQANIYYSNWFDACYGVAVSRFTLIFPEPTNEQSARYLANFFGGLDAHANDTWSIQSSAYTAVSRLG